MHRMQSRQSRLKLHEVGFGEAAADIHIAGVKRRSVDSCGQPAYKHELDLGVDEEVST